MSALASTYFISPPQSIQLFSELTLEDQMVVPGGVISAGQLQALVAVQTEQIEEVEVPDIGPTLFVEIPVAPMEEIEVGPVEDADFAAYGGQPMKDAIREMMRYTMKLEPYAVGAERSENVAHTHEGPKSTSLACVYCVINDLRTARATKKPLADDVVEALIHLLLQHPNLL